MHFLENFGQKSAFLGQKQCFFGQVLYYMVYIAYFTELNLQICNYAQKQRICRKNCKYAFDENFHGHFCPQRKAAKFCHPATRWCHSYSGGDYQYLEDAIASEQNQLNKTYQTKLPLPNLTIQTKLTKPNLQN